MKVTVLLFAGPREALGRRSIEVELGGARATVEDVVDALVAAHPALARWRGRAALAVNRAVAGPHDEVSAGDEVALLPPVSGGAEERPRADAAEAPASSTRSRLAEAAFGADATLQALAKDGAGAVVCFLGLVRSPADAGPVDALEFEAYEAMAEQELAAVSARASEKFGLVDARILHRVGRVPRGEPVVLVAVSAAHRREAFAAAAWIMDELKSVVPVWKKETGPWGARWVRDAEGDA